jgi:hypothetical protein
MLAGGGAAAVAQSFATEDGYFRFTPDRIESEGVAIVASDLWLDGESDDAPNWLLDTLDVDIRLRVSGATPTDDVFVGIGRTPDVDRYLAGTHYSEVVDMDGHVPRYLDAEGSSTVDDPATAGVWVSSSSGEGEQELSGDARGGTWSIVVLNADGSTGVAADVEVGVRSGAVTPIAIFLMVVGGLFLTGAVVLIVIGARGRRHDHDEPITRRPAPPAFPPPAPPGNERCLARRATQRDFEMN